jgi:hypothetical protein
MLICECIFVTNIYRWYDEKKEEKKSQMINRGGKLEGYETIFEPWGVSINLESIYNEIIFLSSLRFEVFCKNVKFWRTWVKRVTTVLSVKLYLLFARKRLFFFMLFVKQHDIYRVSSKGVLIVKPLKKIKISKFCIFFIPLTELITK